MSSMHSSSRAIWLHLLLFFADIPAFTTQSRFPPASRAYFHFADVGPCWSWPPGTAFRSDSGRSETKKRLDPLRRTVDTTTNHPRVQNRELDQDIFSISQIARHSSKFLIGKSQDRSKSYDTTGNLVKGPLRKSQNS